MSESYNAYEYSCPVGYHLLVPGEMLTREDLYWSTKWYRVSDTMELGPVRDDWRCARKISTMQTYTITSPELASHMHHDWQFGGRKDYLLLVCAREGIPIDRVRHWMLHDAPEGFWHPPYPGRHVVVSFDEEPLVSCAGPTCWCFHGEVEGKV